jgi:hypothetical protein
MKKFFILMVATLGQSFFGNYNEEAQSRLVEKIIGLISQNSAVLEKFAVPSSVLSAIVSDVSKLSISKGPVDLVVNEKTSQEQCNALCGLIERYLLAMVVSLITSELGVGVVPSFLIFAANKFGRVAIETVLQFSMVKFGKTEIEKLDKEAATKGLLCWVSSYFSSTGWNTPSKNVVLAKFKELSHWIMGTLRLSWGVDLIMEKLENLSVYCAETGAYLKSDIGDFAEICSKIKAFYKKYHGDKASMQGLLNVILAKVEHGDRMCNTMKYIDQKLAEKGE